MANFRVRFLNNSISGKGGMGAVLFAVTLLFSVLLGIWWCFWKLWTWILPAIYPTGPEALINPGYWMFVGMVILVAFVAGFFKSSK